MKFAIFATLFATLASSGYAATPEAPAMRGAAPANVVQVEIPEAATVATDAERRDLQEGCSDCCNQDDCG